MNENIKYIGAPIALVLLYYFGHGSLFMTGNETSFIFVLLSCLSIEYFINKAENEEVYLRPIAGIDAMEEAVGRATEMGKSVLYVPGISGLDQVDTLSGLIILGHTAGMTAKYEADLHVPVASPIVMETAKESCKESYLRAGRPDLYKEDMVHYVTDDQFAYAAAVNGIMQRDEPAACLYMGKFFAESLLFAETGNSIGAIQIAGTGSQTQIPFFVTACDYTLMGEEFFAASAYLSKQPELIAGITAQDIIKIILVGFILLLIVSRAFFDLGVTEFNLVTWLGL